VCTVLDSPGECVTVNFGQLPFRFNLEGMLQEYNEQQEAEVHRCTCFLFALINLLSMLIFSNLLHVQPLHGSTHAYSALMCIALLQLSTAPRTV
jgi:hypothetical protein